jgi:serine protease Do
VNNIKTIFSCLILFSMIYIVCCDTSHADSQPGPAQGSINQAISMVTPALVQIHALSTSYHRGREIKNESTGSGTIISPDGYIITNHHVVGHAVRLRCTLLDNEEIEAELIGTDALSDIAIIRLKYENGRVFPFASFGDSSLMKVGEEIIAMGSPISLSQSVTYGVVSNIGMTIPKAYRKNRYTFRLDGEDVGSFVLWIGHDAAIYPGNSGGPLVNLKGQIIGINEIVFGLSGAIPSNLAKEVAIQLKKKGSVTRSYLGINVQPLFKHSKNTKGGMINDVVQESPAKIAGFKSGDILLRIGEHPVNLHYYEEMPLFHQMTATLPIGKPIKAEVIRNNEPIVLTVTPSVREPAQPKTVESKPWGITIRDISSGARKTLKLKDQNGILVTSVRPGGPSGLAKPVVMPKDVIKKINNIPIRDNKHFLSITNDIIKNKTEPVPTLIEAKREAQSYISVIQVGIQKNRDQGLEVRKAWLPLNTQVITREIAKILEIPDLTGIRITRLLDKKFCKNTGLYIGDLIVGLDGEIIPAAFPEDSEIFDSMIRQYRVGSKVNLDILRNDEKLTVSVELPRSPKPARELKKYQDDNYEFLVRDLSFMKKVNNQWPLDQKGVIVDEVEPGSWAALGELSVDDLIIEVNNQSVTDVDQFEQIMEKLNSKKPEVIVMHILRRSNHKFLELESEWE